MTVIGEFSIAHHLWIKMLNGVTYDDGDWHCIKHYRYMSVAHRKCDNSCRYACFLPDTQLLNKKRPHLLLTYVSYIIFAEL